MGALVLPGRHVRGLFLQEKSESCLVAKRLPAMARFRQLRLSTTDVTLSVTESHQSGDDLDTIIRGIPHAPSARPGWSGEMAYYSISRARPGHFVG
jgi:hypothetical protein